MKTRTVTFPSFGTYPGNAVNIVSQDSEKPTAEAQFAAFSAACREDIEGLETFVRSNDEWISMNEQIQEEFIDYVFSQTGKDYRTLKRELKFKFGPNLMLSVDYLPSVMHTLPTNVIAIDSHRGEEVRPVRRFVHEKLVVQQGQVTEANLREILASPLSLPEDTHSYPEESLEFYIGDSETPLSLYELEELLKS